MANIPILSFNSGEASPQIDARSDVEKYSSLCRHLENMIPRIYGGAERRPGTKYIYSAKTNLVRLIPFTFSSDISYMIEFGNLYARFYYNGAILLVGIIPVEVVTPYLATDLFQLQYEQIGDVMWIVHSNYKPRKLTRTSATAFSLNEIDFRKGPFLTRNDLLDPNVSDTAFLRPNVTIVGGEGTMHCEDSTGSDLSFFSDNHLSALFKLLQPRANTIVSQTGAGTSSSLDVEGTFSFNTHGTWTGTVVLQRRENSIADSDWEDYRTYIGKADRNIQLTAMEESDNVEYRIYAQTGMSSGFSADITVNNSTQEGIVKVTEVISDSTVRIEVLKKLASTSATRRWAEGAWSDYRGYLISVTFFGERCVYAGSSVIPSQVS
jgi:hypothetical protein